MIDWSFLFGCVLVAVVGGMIPYHAVAGFYYRKYYLRRRESPQDWKCQPERIPSSEELKSAVLRGSVNLAWSGTITGVLVYFWIEGLLETPIYTDLTEYGWGYTIGSTVLLFVLTDWSAYWVHRLLHVKFIYKRIHRRHHRYIATTPYVALASHPLELFSQYVATFLPLFVIPFHAASIAVVLLYNLVFNVIDHSGVRLVSALPWQPPSKFHDDHHRHFHVNFGQHLMLWDRMHGTLRRQNRRYGPEVFGGRGAGEDGSLAEVAALEPYVKYE